MIPFVPIAFAVLAFLAWRYDARARRAYEATLSEAEKRQFRALRRVHPSKWRAAIALKQQEGINKNSRQSKSEMHHRCVTRRAPAPSPRQRGGPSACRCVTHKTPRTHGLCLLFGRCGNKKQRPERAELQMIPSRHWPE